jgi:hypothetical protein
VSSDPPIANSHHTAALFAEAIANSHRTGSKIEGRTETISSTARPSTIRRQQLGDHSRLASSLRRPDKYRFRRIPAVTPFYCTRHAGPSHAVLLQQNKHGRTGGAHCHLQQHTKPTRSDSIKIRCKCHPPTTDVAHNSLSRAGMISCRTDDIAASAITRMSDRATDKRRMSRQTNQAQNDTVRFCCVKYGLAFNFSNVQWTLFFH